MQLEKLIETIKKLLALSNGVGATDAEKDLAFKRAQSLMAKYCIFNLNTDHDKDIKELVIQEIYKTNIKLPVYLQSCVNFTAIFESTAHNFGCYLAFKIQSNEVCIFGFQTNIEVLRYIIDTLIQQGMYDFRLNYSKRREIGFSTSFWTGFKKGLDARFSRKNLEEQALILYDKVKDVFESKVQYRNVEVETSTAGGFNIGEKSATDAQLHSGISSSKGNLLSCHDNA